MRSIRLGFAGASLCIDMEAWQQQFLRITEWLSVVENRPFPFAPASPRALVIRHLGACRRGAFNAVYRL